MNILRFLLLSLVLCLCLSPASGKGGGKGRGKSPGGTRRYPPPLGRRRSPSPGGGVRNGPPPPGGAWANGPPPLRNGPPPPGGNGGRRRSSSPGSSSQGSSSQGSSSQGSSSRGSSSLHLPGVAGGSSRRSWGSSWGGQSSSPGGSRWSNGPPPPPGGAGGAGGGRRSPSPVRNAPPPRQGAWANGAPQRRGDSPVRNVPPRNGGPRNGPPPLPGNGPPQGNVRIGNAGVMNQERLFNQNHQRPNVRPGEPVSHTGQIGLARTRPLQDRDRNPLVGNDPGEYRAITTTDVRLHGNGQNNQHRPPVDQRAVLTGSNREDFGQTRFGAVHYNTQARPDVNRPGRYIQNDRSSVYTHHTNRAVGAPRNQGPAQERFLDNINSPRRGNQAGAHLEPTFPVPERGFVNHQVGAARDFYN